MRTTPTHRVRIGGALPWSTWRVAELRGAGFPASMVRSLGDESLAAAADNPVFDDFAAEYHRATRRLSASIRTIAAEPRFREAVAWQNPALLERCLDKLTDGVDRKAKDQRRRELTVASYAQRYAVKNDSIGFFGPVCWAEWSNTSGAVEVHAGPAMLAKRAVYFEYWAIDAIADAIAADPEVLPWLRPRRSAEIVLDGATPGVRRPRGGVVPLPDAEYTLLRRCDGVRTVDELRADHGPAVPEMLSALADRGLVRLDLRGPVEARPEVTLLRKLAAIDDDAVRARVTAMLDEVVAARDAVAAAAGDGDRIVAATSALNEAFERHTAQRSTRRPGEAYAGRTLIYEETTRDATVNFGPPLLDALRPALVPLLDSARWLVGRVAAAYVELFDELYERLCQRCGRPDVPAATFVGAAAPDIAFSFRDLAPPVALVVREFQRRWAEILCIPEGARRHRVGAADVAAQVRRCFPDVGPPPWSSAVHHAPDILVAAPGTTMLDADRALFVLGELHVAMNSMDCLAFREQYHDPSWLRQADDLDHGGGRVFPVPSKESTLVTSRTYPSALLSGRHTYWCMHSDHTGAPGPVLPAADLYVVRRGEDLVVRSRDRDDLEFPVLEFMGEFLSGAVVNAFRPLPSAAHTPRVVIDNVVLSREAWSLPVRELAWAFLTSASERYRQARRWRTATGVPERAFFKVPTEDKPVFVDFTSIAFVELLARAVRASADEPDDPRVTFSEMLPDVNECWFRDQSGAAYTSELRMIFVDPRATEDTS